MNYQQTLDYLFSQLPMYQRVGQAAYKADLKNTIALCEVLGNPQRKFKSIHIAGTNGKGSVSHFLAAVFQSAGYKTGLYTSPHYKDFRERIKINGKMIPEEKVVEFVTHYQRDFEQIQPSFFEMTVGMAFEHFADEKVDFAILETGMGGRLDSTNVVTPEISVITNIGFDHERFLGDTLEKIAAEKAGIIKENIPVVIGETQDETEAVFRQFSTDKNAPITFADKKFKAEKRSGVSNQMAFNLFRKDKKVLDNIISPLTASYQVKNIITTICAIDFLRESGCNINNDDIRNGIANVKQLTGILGRWQKLNDQPLTYCDSGHNIAGITEALKQIQATDFEHLHFVLGTVNDKKLEPILSMLPKDATYYFCQPDIPRAMAVKTLAETASNYGLKGAVFQSVKKALREAQQKAGVKDLVFVGGSTFVVAEVL